MLHAFITAQSPKRTEAFYDQQCSLFIS